MRIYSNMLDMHKYDARIDAGGQVYAVLDHAELNIIIKYGILR